MPEKRIIIIAGPNGAGKTTFAREYLPLEVGITTFINADLIAAGLSPFAPELAARRAGRLMLEEIDRCVAQGISQGGHSIPEPVIQRRFTAGLANFDQHYRSAVDGWQLIDNGGDAPVLLAEGINR